MTSKSNHELVPEHAIMSDKETKELTERMRIGTGNLPKILDTDPQAVALEAKPGQVIKIHRKDGKNEYDYYRIVVQG